MSCLTEAAVKARVAELLGRVRDGNCPVRLPATSMVVNTTFDLRGLAAGQCKARKTSEGVAVTIRINRKAMEFEGGNFVMNEVIPHEIAHAFAAAILFDETLSHRSRSPFKGHGSGWRLLAKWLGASGDRTCAVGLNPSRNTRPFTYRASCGTEVQLTKGKHVKIQAGQRWILRRTGGSIVASGFVATT